MKRRTAEDWAKEWACCGCQHYNGKACEGPGRHGCISYSRIKSYTKAVIHWARRILKAESKGGGK